MLRSLRRNPLSISGHQALLTRLRFPQNQIQRPVEPAPYTVFYLFSSASTFDRKPSDKPDSIPSLLSRYGFSESQIQGIVHRVPWLTSANTEKTIRPKLDFLLAFGYSPAELINFVSSNPYILKSSLEGWITPRLNHLETIFGSKELLKKAIGCCNRLLCVRLENTLMPNINTLKEYGIPPRSIVQALAIYTRSMTVNNDTFTKAVKKVKELGIEPSSTLFVIGVHVMLGLSEANWKRKLEFYQSFGWSEKDTLFAFAKYPFCMSKSEDKIKKVMEFFVEKLCVDSTYLALYPTMFSYSLEKRIIPRCAVVNVLMSKGMLDDIPAWTYLFYMSEKDFKQNFIDKYRKEVPHVLDAFQGKVEFTGFDLMKKKKQ